MTEIEVTLQGVEIPTNTSVTLTVLEDVGDDGGSNTYTAQDGTAYGYDNIDTITLSGGQTSYTVSGFDASSGNRVWPIYKPDNSDPEVTAKLTEATELNPVQPPPEITGTLFASLGGDFDDIVLTLPDVDWGGEVGDYQIYRAEASGSTRSDYTQIDTVGGSNDEYTDIDLEDGERFYYRVGAVNSGGESDLSNEDDATTDLPEPAIGDTYYYQQTQEIEVPWTINDNSGDGGVDIERSTDDGDTWSTIATGLDPGSSPYYDSDVPLGETYTYRIERNTDHATATSGTDSTTLVAPPEITGTLTSSVSGDDVTLDLPSVDWNEEVGTWNINRGDSSGNLIGYDDTDGSNTTYTDSALEDGERYFYTVRATNSAGSSDESNETDETTAVPAPTLDALSQSGEDVLVEWTKNDDSSDGGVDVERSTDGGSSWSTIASGLDPSTTEFTDTSAPAGTVHYRVERNTDHATATSGSQSIDVLGISNTQVDSTTPTSATLSWQDDSESEDGFTVERREQFRDGFEAWAEISTLEANSGTGEVTWTDDSVLPNTTYEWRVTVFDADTEVTGDVVQATTDDDGVRADRVSAEGWHVVVEDSAGNQLEPTIVGEPVHRPRLNDLPTVEIPVPDAARWSDSTEWERQPMRVYHDGERLPIEQVQRVRQEPGQAMLVGVGGVDLREQVSVDVIEQDAHLTAEDLVQDETDLTANVDDPNAETTADLLQQSADAESEWDDVLEALPGAQDVFETTSTGELATRQTAYFVEAEDATVSNGSELIEQDSNRWSGGRVIDFEQAGLNTYLEATVSTDHAIPSHQIAVAIRTQQPGDGNYGFDLELDGATVTDFPADALATGETEPNWSLQSASSEFSNPLGAGEHTIRLQFDESTSADEGSVYVDAVCLYDDRFDAGFSEQVTDGVLEGPDEYPSGIQTETVDAVSVRQVIGGRLEATFNDTAGSQAVAISNDSGATWIEAQNSQSVEGAFGDGSTSIRARFTIGGFDDDPTTSPAGRTAPQRVDLFELFADLEDTPLLANRSWDQTLLTILQDIARYGNFIFEVVWDESSDGLAVEWTQAGQRTASIDPSLVDYQTETDYSSIHRRAVIYGTGVPESSTITAQHDSWVALEHDWLHETGEVVESTADDTTYERSVDYELRPNAGELEALSTGGISDGEELRVSYDKRIRGTFESEDYTGDYETFVDDIPSITTTRNADAAALAIVQETNEPLHTASVTVDVSPGGMSLVEAVDLDQLPVDEPLEVWSVDNSPGQVTMQLGSREEVSETVSRIQERLGATSRKV